MKLSPPQNEILYLLHKYQRNFLEELICLLFSSKKIHFSLIWELLIELFSTMKMTFLQEGPRISLSEILDFLNFNEQYKLISSFGTFTGSLLHVRNMLGEDLAIKIMYPKKVRFIREYAEVVIHLLDPYPIDTRLINFIYNELYGVIEKEINLKREAKFLDIFYKASQEIPNIIVPKPLPQVSSDSTLVMEWVYGENLGHWETLDFSFKRELSRRLLLFHNKIIEDTGIFRYDYHWSNLKLTDDNRLGILDYGSIIELNSSRIDIPIREIENSELELNSNNLKIAANQWVRNFLLQIPQK
jgi:hypothetical protein